jgi:trimethylamine:corrinoid methyltransferase-like protein
MGKRVGAGVHPISPLVLGGEELDLALRLMDQGTLGSVGTAGMPVMGVTAPLDWVAGWAQAVAEAAGAAIALEALGAKRVSAFAALYVAEMRTGALVFGSAEHALITLAEAKVNREILGSLRRSAKAAYTTAKTPAAQAAAEKTAHTVVALLGGYRDLGSIGILAVDEVFSPQQVFIDLDIVGHAWRIARGIEAKHAGGDVVALVREGIASAEHFLAAPNTLARFRDFYWAPGIFDHRATATWLVSPTDALDEAWARSRQLLEGYDYELDADRQRALRKVMDDARRQLCG